MPFPKTQLFLQFLSVDVFVCSITRFCLFEEFKNFKNKSCSKIITLMNTSAVVAIINFYFHYFIQLLQDTLLYIRTAFLSFG